MKNILFDVSGRAGRVSKGYCYRLVTKDFWEREIPDFVIPEMQVIIIFLPFLCVYVCGIQYSTVHLTSLKKHTCLD